MGEIGQNRFDDTPVNGQTKRGITSNWAFDEDVTLRALIEETLPWTIFIDVLHSPKSQVNWNQITVSAAILHAAALDSSNAQNNSIAWDVILAAGTWSLELFTLKGDDRAVISIQFDSVEKATIDTYAASYTSNILASVTDIVVPTTKKIELKLKTTTKNQLSSGYYASIMSVRLMRTA